LEAQAGLRVIDRFARAEVARRIFHSTRIAAESVPGESLRVFGEGLVQVAGEQRHAAVGCAAEVQPGEGLVAPHGAVAAKAVGFETRGVGAPGEAVTFAVAGDARAGGSPVARREAAAERGRTVAGG